MKFKFFNKIFNRTLKENDLSEANAGKSDDKNAIEIPIELQAVPVINIENFTSFEEAKTKILNKLYKDQKSIICNIEEEFNQNENFSSLNDALENQQVIAIQSTIDGKFFTIWKWENEVYGLKLFDIIIKQDLEELCKFIVEFLCKCLMLNHSGVLKSANNLLNLPLSSLTDINGLNLLFHAAQSGDTKVVKILLQCAFDVNIPHNRLLPIDFAYENQNFETIFELLKLNSMFPHNLNVEECPEDLKEFIEMSSKFHENIKAGNIEEIRQTLTQHPNLRYFYSPQNFSASAVAIACKQFDIYELFITKNLFLLVWEEMEELTAFLTKDERKELREIHFRNKKDIQETHIIALMSKCSVGHDVFEVQDKLDHVQRAFRVINNFLAIQILLKIAALLKNLRIVFDFKRKSVEYLDPTSDGSTLGLFYGNGRIYVGAKQLLDPKTEHEVFATIAHELCHFVLFNVFGCNAWPYEENDEKTAEEFETISEECRGKKSVDKIIELVYDCYPSEMFHAELIVRIPHFFAHYYNKPEKIEMLRREFKSLFDFYEINLIHKLENELIKLRKELEKERKAKDRKISILLKIMVFGFISLISIAICVGFYFYEPNYNWSELKKYQKEKVYNSAVDFEGKIFKFSDLYDENDSSEVFKVLKSQQIKKLLRNEILNLNETENSFLLATQYLEIVDGKIFETLCCNWANVMILNRSIQTFEVQDETKIQTNIARIHPKYKNDNVEEFKIGNWCNDRYCRDRSNIKNLPVSIYKVFPNLITYKAQQYSVKHLKRDNFKGLKKLRNLDLGDNAIEIIDENSFVDLTELNYFYVGSNKIQFLSQNLFKNNLKLVYLNFYVNQITSVNSEHFNHLINLKELSLCHNNLTNIESNLFETLVNLEKLHLCINPFSSLPNDIFSKLPNLTYIDLSKNQLTTLNENIFKENHNLNNLELWTNKITNLSSKLFDDKPNLAHVDLRWNPCINTEYGKKENLQIPLTDEVKNQLKKDLDENCLNYMEYIEGKYSIEQCCEWSKDILIDRKIQAFQIFDYSIIYTETAQIRRRYESDEVEKFAIYNWCNDKYCFDRNNIQFLPIRISEIFPNLIAYYAQNYNVKRLKRDNFKGLKKLQNLDLYDNLIETIDEDAFEDLIELRKINLHKNKIKALSLKTFKNNLKLVYLNFYTNQITSVSSQHFEHLINLRDLYLCGNNLSLIEAKMFDTLINLESLTLCTNQLTSLPVDIFNTIVNLTDLHLAQNQFITLDENILNNNSKLKKIELWDNKIKRLSSKLFDDKPYLAYVNLGGNACIQKEYGKRENLEISLTNDMKSQLKKDVDENCS